MFNVISAPEEEFSIKGSLKERFRTATVRLDTLLKEEFFYRHEALHTNLTISIKVLYKCLERLTAPELFQKVSHVEGISDILTSIHDVSNDFLNKYENDFKEVTLLNSASYFDFITEFEMHLQYHLLAIQTLESRLGKEKIAFEFNDPDANQFWTDNFKDKFSVDKLTFLKAFAKTDFQFNEFVEELLDPTSDDIITVTDFKIFLSWFGPFKKSVENANHVLSYPYFFGAMTSLEAQRLLDNQPIGTFLVRFSEKDFGNFVISCVEEDHEEQHTLHFKVFRKGDRFYLLESEMEHTTIKDLLDSYPLTYRTPYKDETHKISKIQPFIEPKRKLLFSAYRGKIEHPDVIHLKRELTGLKRSESSVIDISVK